MEKYEEKGYFFDDFTLENYKKIINITKEKYSFIGYTDYRKDGCNVLWRHDVDYSLERALDLAKIESECGIKSTYFIYSHSEGYNLFEIESAKIVNQIINLGHDIGLHADYGYYREILNDTSNCEERIKEEIDKVERDFRTKIYSISFHQPEYRDILGIDDEYFAGVVNAYSKYITEEYGYCSDSNGYWRFHRLEDYLQTSNRRKIHILLHPIWWTDVVMSPAQRMTSYYKSKSEKQWKLYCLDMKRGKRINIGENDI